MNRPSPLPVDPLEPDPPPNVPSQEDIERAEALRRRLERELLPDDQRPARGGPEAPR